MTLPFKNRDERAAAFAAVDLYPVISSEFTLGQPVLTVLQAIADGGAKIVQLREKHRSKREIYELARQYREITAAHRMLLIINDHLDIALAANADGVHLGQDDLPLQAARQAGPELLLGSSTHNQKEADDSIRNGADYINIGPIYPTDTKTVSCGAVGLETLATITAGIKLPFTVMGGIKERHLPELLRRGATHIAMVTEIIQAEDIAKQVAHLRSFWAPR